MVDFLQNFLVIGQDGLHLIATAVLPVLFPFFVLTSLILNLTTTTHPWLIVLLSFCSGYPNGARLTQTLYQEKRITLLQAKQLSIITSTPSPVFVIATAGTIFLQDTKLGCIIFLCAVISALFNGYIWTYKTNPQTTKTITTVTPTKQQRSFFTAFSNALTSATTSIINVCGVILFFYICVHLLLLPPFLAGLVEMTTGVAGTTNPFLVQTFVTFGGFSVAMQQQIFMQKFQIKLTTYIIYKTTQTILACALLSLYLLFLN